MIRITVDDREVKKALSDFQKRQLPYATALALTDVANQVRDAEKAALQKSIDRPTPFTMNAVGVIPARKSTLRATVFAKDIQSAYLAPYIVGGRQALGSKAAILTPRDLKTNQYGNIPRNRIAALKGKPGVFVGVVKFKNGQEIGGVWQRGVRGKQRGRRGPRTGPYGAKGRLHDYGTGQKTTLKLLIQFTNPSEVTHRVPWGATAVTAVEKAYTPAFDRALAKALATAR